MASLAENGLIKKLIGFFSFEADEQESEEYGRHDHEAEPPAVCSTDRKVVPLHSNLSQMTVTINDPQGISDAREIADNLKRNMIVIMNISKVEKDLAKEILYFLSGTVYALGGSSKKVGDGVFLFTPNTVPIKELEDLAIKHKNTENLMLADL